jgi:hypothetical protein
MILPEFSRSSKIKLLPVDPEMAYPDRPSGKRVTFEEPIFIDIEETEKLEYERPRPRARKLVLWAIAALFLFFLVGGSHGTFSFAVTHFTI